MNSTPHTSPTTPPALLAAPYTVPAVRIGDKIHCLFRDTLCKVIWFTSARIIWPRVQPIGQRGGSGLLVDDELIRAIRTESGQSLGYWWGVSRNVVSRWRRWQCIGHFGTPGSAMLHEVIMGGWSVEELALLGTAADDEIAELIGRTALAVTLKRTKLKIPSRGHRKPGRPRKSYG